MMTSVNNMFPQANRGQYALAYAISEKYSLTKDKDNGSGKATPLDDNEFLMVSFSQEARKLLQDQRETEIKGKIRQALKEERAKTEKLAEQNRAAKKEVDAKKIGEMKSQLKELLARLRQALMFGDKRAAATIAKEAARLAKGLAAALKDSGAGNSGDSLAIPVVNAEGSQEASDTANAGENLNIEESETPENSENSETGNAGQMAAAREITKEALAKTKGLPLKDGDEEDLKQIVAILRTIVSMLRGTMRHKSSNSAASASQPESQQTDEVQKNSEKAIKEIEDAIKSIGK